MRDLCSLCSNLGKVEGDLKLNYLNQKLINIFGRINLSSPKFLDSKGKLYADISLNNAVEGPAFNIKSLILLIIKNSSYLIFSYPY